MVPSCEMLRPEIDYVAATGSGCKQKLDGEACHRPQRVSLLVLLDVALRPSRYPVLLILCRVTPSVGSSRDPAFGHRPLKHRPQRVEEVALCEWRTGLLVDNALHMLAGQQHDAADHSSRSGNTFVAMCLAEIFKDVSPRALCLGGERLERRSRARRAVEIADDKLIRVTRKGSCRAELQAGGSPASAD